MHAVGTQEFKDHLTHYLRLVRRGMTFVVTDRGKPVAVLKPIDDEAENNLEGILTSLATEGSISLPQGKGFLKKAPTIRGKGTTLSQLVLEGRR